MENNKLAYSPAEAAEVMGISRQTVYALIRANRDFPTFKLGGRRLINAAALQKWIDAQTEAEYGR